MRISVIILLLFRRDMSLSSEHPSTDLDLYTQGCRHILGMKTILNIMAVEPKNKTITQGGNIIILLPSRDDEQIWCPFCDGERYVSKAKVGNLRRHLKENRPSVSVN